MTTDATVLGAVDHWRGTGGPASWSEAWERALDELISVRTAHGDDDPLGPYRRRWAEGAAGLALTYYLLASTTAAPVACVVTAEVRALAPVLDNAHGAWEAVVRLDALFERAGHRLDASADPVAACWRKLRADCSPVPPYSDFVEADWTTRWGADKLVSLTVVLNLLDDESAAA